MILNYRGSEVGRLSMQFLHDGIPMPTRKAIVSDAVKAAAMLESLAGDFKPLLLSNLAHPNIASKHWIIRQYDHEVQGGSVIKPLIGPLQIGPSDAAVLRPKLNSYRASPSAAAWRPAIADPYAMAIASIDEAIRNVVAVGADHSRIAILDNFCWPSVDDEITMGTLVRACEACRDAALALRHPVHQRQGFAAQPVHQPGNRPGHPHSPTLLISAIGVVRGCPQVRHDGSEEAREPAVFGQRPGCGGSDIAVGASPGDGSGDRHR